MIIHCFTDQFRNIAKPGTGPGHCSGSFSSTYFPHFRFCFFLASSTFSRLVADLFTIKCLGDLGLHVWALPRLAQIWSMEYALKLPVKIWLTKACMCVHVHTHTHPSRYTSQTCQQVIIFHADGSELLGAFQLHSLFKLHFLSSLHLFLTPGALGQQTCSALSVLPLLAPIKNCYPELYNFQSKHERYFTTQPSPGAESYLSVKSVQLLSY